MRAAARYNGTRVLTPAAAAAWFILSVTRLAHADPPAPRSPWGFHFLEVTGRAAFGVAASSQGAAFAFDTSLGAVAYIGESPLEDDAVRPTLTAELGLSYGSWSHAEWLGLATVGIGVHTENVWLGWYPSVAYGTANGYDALGMRQALRVSTTLDLLGVEVSYQYLRAGAADVNEFRAVGYVDVGALITMLAYVSRY